MEKVHDWILEKEGDIEKKATEDKQYGKYMSSKRYEEYLILNKAKK
jgi:hypothetical protein